MIAANFVYYFAFGFKPLTKSPKLIMYNFLFFLLIAVAIFFKTSYHLYEWFVKNKGDQKQKTTVMIKEGLNFVKMVLNFFRPGNESNLVYVPINKYRSI